VGWAERDTHVDSERCSPSRVAAKDFLQQTRFSGMPPWVLVGGGKTPAPHPATSHTRRRVHKFLQRRASYLHMSKKYEIYSGKRVVSIQESATPLQAAVDYVRSLGTPDAEITRLGVDAVAWRGARFTASLAPPAQKDSPSPSRHRDAR